MFKFIIKFQIVIIFSFPIFSMDNIDLSKEIIFHNKTADISLAATLTLPKNTQERVPAIILISGSGAFSRQDAGEPFKELTEQFTKLGIAVLTYDKRGIGHSSGNYLAATTRDFADDAEAGIEYLKSCPQIDAKKVGLFGHSEGGLIVAMIAASNKELAFIMLYGAPGMNMLELFTVRTKQGLLRARILQLVPKEQLDLYEKVFAFRLDVVFDEQINVEDALGECLDRATNYLRTQDASAALSGEILSTLKNECAQHSFAWARYVANLTCANFLKSVTIPVLVVNGEMDTLVSPDLNLPPITEALNQAKNKNFMIVRMAGIGHQYREVDENMNDQKLSMPLLNLFSFWLSQQKL